MNAISAEKNKKTSRTAAAASTAESMMMMMKKKKNTNAATCSSSIGLLSFEVARLMSKALHLWHSLSDFQIAKLRYEVFQTEGVRKLVSDDHDFLFSLALSEFMDSLGFLVRSVARIGKRCTDPVLHLFDHVFTHLARNATAADLFGFQYAGKKMERKAKKMERLVAASSNLYQELEVLAELEQTLRRMKIQAKSDPSRRGSLADFKHKVVWQRQEVKRLRDISLWNLTYDCTVRLLARSLFTILGRIKHVFGFHTTTPPRTNVTAALLLDDDNDKDKHSREAAGKLSRCNSVAGLMQSFVHPSEFRCHRGLTQFSSAPLSVASDRTVGGHHLPHSTLPLPHHWMHRNWKKTKWQVSTRSFGGCMVAGADSPVLHSCIQPMDGRLRGADAVQRRTTRGMKEDADKEPSHFRGNISNYTNLYMSFFESQQKPLKASPSTLGAAALALHYANVVIVIEKLAVSPHMIGLDARDDLYSMLPTSIRAALRARLKSYAKNLTSSFYDPILAAEWSDALSRILDWLAPLAHNMIRWQSVRNFEHQQLVSSANILLLQTLYFADQAKSEAVITELLVGLNYLWRFGRELNARAILECVSSRNCDDFLEL